MRIKTISVTYERKINLGDYNSATLGVSIWADVDEDEDPQTLTRELQKQAREHVRDEYKRLAK